MSAPASLQLIRPPGIGGVLRPVALLAGFAVVGAAVGTRPLVAVALVLLGALALAAFSRPDVVAFGAVVAMAVVPVYAAPKVGPLAAHLTVLGCWFAGGALMVGLLLGRLTTRLTFVDGAAALYVLLLTLPVLFGVRETMHFVVLVFTSLGPYLAIRLMVVQRAPSWLPLAFATATLVSLPFVLYETASGTNPFAGIVLNQGEADVWEEGQWRFGMLRAEGAFGHAIALSQFAAAVMLLALGSAILARGRWSARAWMLVVLAGGAQLALSFSRSGWVVFALGVVVVALLVASGRARARLLWSLFGIALVGWIGLVATGLDAVVMRLVSDQELSGSNDYRRVLLERALSGEGLAWFGSPNPSVVGAGIESGTTSIDNTYLALAAEWGYVGLIGIFTVIGAVALALWQTRGTPWALIPAVTLVTFAGLAQVAIITQTEFWLWMLVGGSAGAAAAAQARRATPSQAPEVPPASALAGGGGPAPRTPSAVTAGSGPVAAEPAGPADASGRPLRDGRRGPAGRTRVLLAIGILLTAGVAGFMSARSEPQYTARATLVVPSGVDESRADPDRARAAQAALFSLGAVAEQAARRLGDVSPDQVAGTSEVTFADDSDIVEVATTSGDPRLSARIATAYARSFVDFSRARARKRIEQALSNARRVEARLTDAQRRSEVGRQLQEQISQLAVSASVSATGAEMVEPASVPTTASSPKPVRDGLLGALAGAVIALVASRLRLRTREPEGVLPRPLPATGLGSS